MSTRAKILVIAAMLAGQVWLVAAASDVTASANWLARTWQTDEGLPDNNVTGIEQTADGFLWVATLGGLMRFDGAQFHEYGLEHLPKVLNRNVRKTFLDRRGRFWLALDRGTLVRVDPHAARVFTAEDGLSDGRVTAMAEDAEGALWLAVGNNVFRVAGDKVDRIGPDAGISGGGPSYLGADERGRIWVARRNQLGPMRNGRWQPAVRFESGPVRFVASRRGGFWICADAQVLKFVEGQPPELVSRLPERVRVRVLLEDDGGRLWLGTDADGLLVQTGSEFTTVPVSHSDILDLRQDREGNVWVGTAGGGLNLVRPQAVSLVSGQSGLPFDSVRSVCEDTEGRMWAALQNGELVRSWGAKWNVMTAKEGWPGGNAFCVTAARDGGVWVGMRDQGLRHWKNGQARSWRRSEGLGGGWVRAAMETSKGGLWLATEQPGRLVLFDGKEFHLYEAPEGTRSIRALAETTDGTLWAGTSDGRLLRLQGAKVVSEKAPGLDAAHSIRCLHATADGSLWIGFAGWGVGRFRGGEVSRMDVAQGLYDGYVSQILSDSKDGLWLTGNHGLFRVQYSELVNVAEGQSERLRSIAYGRNEGLPSVQAANECTPTAWRAMDGRLWFATRKGLMVVSPERIRDNPTPPPVKLTRVSVDDKPVALYDSQSPLRAAGESNLVDLATAPVSLELGPSHEKLEFDFTALSFSSPENVHFRYQLEGFDHEWVEAGALRNARFPRLPAGNYRFHVTACNETGTWNPTGASLAFTVRPFFWQTWWFRAGLLGAFTTSVIGLVRYFSFRRLRREVVQLERQAELQRERTRIARDMHDEVGAKLSRLSLLSDLASHQPDLPPAARNEVNEISDTARETIRSFEEVLWAINPKNDSVPNLVHYICRFAEELFEGTEIQCAFELPEDIPPAELSTELRHHVFLAVKEALNNVFKHAAPSRVCLRLKLGRGEFQIGIEDDGCGFASGETVSRAGGGNGLENMRERMRHVGGRMELRSAPGQGTRVTFSVPNPESKSR